ncbi:MAG TPA: LacI family DNA-binding transcriptional regulator [Gaiellaceae bacterium]|nr:LacI family DNA-binding transcriptional regulator [Gaiellaceae bacterium]
MSKSATIYDVAARAGVSIGTVSLALNSPTRVKEETLERINAAIDELAFVPKAEAVVRARRGVGRIGVIAPFTTYPSFARRLNGVLAALRGQSYEAVVYDHEGAGTSLLASLPISRRLDGLVVMSLPLSEQVVQRLQDSQLTTVLVELDRPGFSGVTIDDVAGSSIVADLLVARGHRRFAFIGEGGNRPYPHDRRLQSESRLLGFRAALEEHGYGLPSENVRLVTHDLPAAAAAATELLDLPDRPTAIFAHDDVLASGVLQAARERSLRVPDDLAVVGFDDSELAEHLGLTSVRQPFEESGRVATEILLAQLRDQSRALQHVTLKLALIERKTT